MSFYSQRYKKWKPYNKLMFLLAVVSILIGLFFSGKFVLNISKNVFRNENATFYGNNFQGDFRGSQITINEGEIESDLIHDKKLEIWDDFFDRFNSKYDLYNVKVNLLNSKQKLFLDKFPHDQKLLIAYCNELVSDCLIVNKYKIPSEFNEEDICFILDFDHFNAEHSSALSRGKKFFTNREECYKQILGDNDVLGQWITS